MKKTIEEKNSIVAALFLFQYSLLIPLMGVIRPTMLIAVSGVILMAIAFLLNQKFYINGKVAIVIILLLVFMLGKSVFDGSDPRVALNFLMISLPPIVVYSYHIDTEKFLESCHKLSIINFLLLFMIPFLVRRVAYMRFGYGMLLTVLFSYIKVFRSQSGSDLISTSKKPQRDKVINTIVFVVSLIESIIYGNRGVLVVILSFIAIDILFIYNRNRIRNIFLIALGFIGVLNLEPILNLLIRFTTQRGINSYAIRKYQYQLRYGLEEASSGRGRLYRNAIETIQQHPVFGDRMVTYDDGTLYVHNLFLQVGRDMGVLMMIISIAFVIYCIYLLCIKRETVNQKTIIAVFFCVSVVRLLISSNLWERPEFWALMCIVLSGNYNLSSSTLSSSG